MRSVSTRLVFAKSGLYFAPENKTLGRFLTSASPGPFEKIGVFIGLLGPTGYGDHRHSCDRE
uniref:Uncharacterized protein n=1 Tax=uncultured alpha proteobacterium HF0010_30A23 TaxID=710802 RepID=E0XRK9_9PROT|nr:hypothetical protein [uncultured alpha proteobacterium HF0010_30A23]